MHSSPHGNAINMKDKLYKVRFHLAAGPNYQRWQVRCGDDVKYYDPEDVTLTMYGCTLRNQRKTAEGIYLGKNKTVCAWIQCEHLKVNSNHESFIPDPKGFVAVQYNPRKAPNWFRDNYKNNVDNMSFMCLTTIGRLIVIPDTNEQWKYNESNRKSTQTSQVVQSESDGTNK